jgi:hypothetical protein
MSTWRRSIEELKLASLDRGVRVLGITSPLPSAGCSRLSRQIAEASLQSGTRTLLVDLAQPAPSEPQAAAMPAWAWQAWMTVYEGNGLPSEMAVRDLRRALQSRLMSFRLTRHVVGDVALAASDMAAHIVETAKPQRIAIRVTLAGKALGLEISHDAKPVPELGEILALPPPAEPIGLGDDQLRFALARRALPVWSYAEGYQNRLTGWCNLDGTVPEMTGFVPDNGLERLIAEPVGAARDPFNNVQLMRRLFHEELAQFEAIVVDLPPVVPRHGGRERINPLASIAACDGVYLVCMAGDVDSESLAQTMKLLRQCDAKLVGVVVNEALNPTLGEELAREARRLKRFLPGVSRWLETKALSARLIN